MKRINLGLVQGLSVAALFLTASIAAAERPDGDLMKPTARSAAKTSASAGAVTADDVGDVYSFGRNVKFIGVGQSGTVTLADDCTPDPSFPPGPNDRCIVVNPAPATTVIDERDIGRLNLPGKASNSLLCHWLTPIAFYTFVNGTGGNANATFRLTPYFTVENEVLNDPSLIDPTTGLPYGGSFEVALGTFRDSANLDSGQSETNSMNLSRVCIAGMVSKLNLIDMGLSDAQATEFFKKPTTIRFHLAGTARFVGFASVSYGLRLGGD